MQPAKEVYVERTNTIVILCDKADKLLITGSLID